MASDRRLHPLSFIFTIGATAKQILLPLVGGIFASGGRWGWEALVAFAVIPTAGIALVKALSVRYRLDEGELVVRSGILVKRVTHIPYTRIQNVNAVQSVLHRILRVIEVRIETGGGGDSEATLSVIDESALAELRESVFGPVRAQPATEAVEPGDPGPVLLQLGRRELIVLGLVRGRGMLIAAGIYGFLWESGLARPAQRAIFGASGPPLIFREIGRAITGDASLRLSQVLIVAGGLVATLIIFRVCSGLWTALKFYGFTLREDKGDLRMEYGLLTRVTSGLPLRRIQKVSVYEGPWHRLTGYASVDVQTAASVTETSARAQRVWLAPLIAASDVRTFLERILPTDLEPSWQPVDPRGARREFLRTVRLIAPIAGALVWAFGPWVLAGLVPIVAFAWMRSRRYVASLRWSTAGDLVQFEGGWIYRRVSIVPLSKVQAVSQGESPFDRRHRMRSLEIDVAGGVTTRSMRMPYLPALRAATVAADVATRSEVVPTGGAQR